MLLPDKKRLKCLLEHASTSILPSSSLFSSCPLLATIPWRKHATGVRNGKTEQKENVSPSHTQKAAAEKPTTLFREPKRKHHPPEFNSHDFGSEGIRLKAEIDKGVD
ncbi:hypothetical protein CEXT_418311 [Caerostris extrusa]|uniref:Uncharacterized protein n=1 Tax=Caerostris extrusa TaxID=172846 RepID=A0AAV4TDR2_CAEEX|nr:hypothetical protein CEXT_418311 [Caerostris extrusa]